MMGYSGLNRRRKQGVEIKMKITISFYGKRIEIVFQCAFHIRLCFPPSNNCHCMHLMSWTMHVVPYMGTPNRL
jgi:hypothetical protein